MGDSQNDPVRVDFDRKIKLEFSGSTVTSDAGLLAYRELGNALGLTSTAATRLHDTRTGQNTQHGLLALLRQSIDSRLAGYEDVNDAERLCLDPALRTVVGGRAKDTQAASTSEMARFETETLSTQENLKHLMDLSGQWIDQAHQHRTLKKLILDMDSSVSETYGHQEGRASNGHFAWTCYQPLFLFNQFGDLERVVLRRGNRGSAKYWRRVLLPVIARYRGLDIPKFFRGDAAFAGPKLLRLLEREGFRYAIRIKANAVLERISGHERRRSVMGAGLRLRWRGYRRRCFGENRCNRSCAWVRCPSGVAAEAPGGVHRGKIGSKNPEVQGDGNQEILTPEHGGTG